MSTHSLNSSIPVSIPTSVRTAHRCGVPKFNKRTPTLVVEGLAVVAIIVLLVGMHADLKRQARLEVNDGATQCHLCVNDFSH